MDAVHIIVAMQHNKYTYATDHFAIIAIGYALALSVLMYNYANMGAVSFQRTCRDVRRTHIQTEGTCH